MRKTLEEVREHAERNDCVLLTDSYTDYNTVIEFICSCGQKDDKKYSNFRKNAKCNFRNHNYILKLRDIKGLLEENSNNTYERDESETEDSSEEIILKELPDKTIKWVNTSKKIHGDIIDFKYIEPKIYKSRTKFILKCKICDFKWKTDRRGLLELKNGCPWCRNKCYRYPKNELSVIKFIGSKIHDNKYRYENNPDYIKSTQDEINIQCIKHGPFKEKLSKHLSISKGRHGPKGCEVCLIEKKATNNDKFVRDWTHQVDKFIKASKRIHGFGKFSYEFIKKEDLTNGLNSMLTLQCKSISNDGAICDHKFCVSINSHLYDISGCDHCTTNKYTYEIFVRKFNKYYQDVFSIQLVKEDDIKGYKSKPKLTCVDCGFINDTTNIHNLFSSKVKLKCMNCNGGLKWTEERLLEKCKEREKGNIYIYKYIKYDDNNINSYTLIRNIICINCKNKGYKNHMFNQKIYMHFNSNHGCPRCGGSMPWDYDRFMDEISILPISFTQNYDYSMVDPSKIKSFKCKVSIKCVNCNNISQICVSRHINGSGCTYCPKSLGSREVYDYLKENNIEFADEVPIKVLETNTCYFYDYKIFNYNDYDIILEYDGLQHFKIVNYWQTPKIFNESRKRDIYKHNKALENGCRVIRIDYSVKIFDIRKHLDNALQSTEMVYFSNTQLYEWLK